MMAQLKYLTDVVTLELFPEKCIGCEMCVNVCPHAVFKMKGKKVEMVDRDACMECGACSRNCPVEAIAVTAGVGCASGIINGLIRGTEPTCDCGDDSSSCC